MVIRVPIIGPVHAEYATEEDGPFSDTFIGDRGKVWDIIYLLLRVTDAWTHMQISRSNHNGQKAMIALYDHFLRPNNVDYPQKQAYTKLQNLTYAGEINKWNFERFVTKHNKKQTILEGLTDYGYNGLNNRTKVTHMMDGVKLDSPNTAK